MSNTNDPKSGKPNDPKKPEKKPDVYQSAFDFALPDGAGSFSDIEPPAPPSTSDPEMGTAAPLPPKPEAARGSKNSFEFTLSDAEFELPPESGTNLTKPPRPTDAAPPAPRPPAKSDSGINLGALPKLPSTAEVPALPKPPSSATLRLPDLPPVPKPPSSPVFELPPEPPVALPVPTLFDLPPFAEPPVPQPPSSPTFELPPVAVPVPTSFDIPPFADPPSTPTLELPPLPQPPSSPTFELPPIPTAAPLSREFELPEVPLAQALSREFELPPVPDTAGPASGLFALPDPNELALAEPTSDVLKGVDNVPPLQPASDVFDLPALEEVTFAEPASAVFQLPPVPVAEFPKPPSDVFTLPPVADGKAQPSSTFELPPVPKAPSEPVVQVPPLAKPESVPDLDSVVNAPAAFAPVPTPLSAIGIKPLSSQDLGPVVPPDTHEVPLADLPGLELAQPLSGLNLEITPVLPEPVKPVKTPPPVAPPAAAAYASAFDFGLPEGVDSFSDIAPPEVPSTSDPEMGTAAPLPPRPEATHGSKNSFEFTLSDPNFELPAEPAAPARPPRASDPAPTPAAPVPSSGSVPDIAAKLGLAAPVPAPKDPADVFGDLSGVKPVQPVSDWLDSQVIPAKTNEQGLIVPDAPLDAPGAGDAPNTFDIFGGERVLEADAADLSDVLTATGSGRGSSVVDYSAPEAEVVEDGESIHDMELPEDALPAVSDEPDYAAPVSAGPDASSILSELADPLPHQPGDSSGIRLEAPGTGRTLEGNPNDQFDITLLDEPVPADLEAASGAPADEPTSWDQQSGSDLFAERRPAPRAPADDEGRVNPIDSDLVPDDPSLTSDPQSIFSGVKGGDGSSTSVGSGSVRIGAPSDPDITAERNPARPPAVAPRKPSSADFQLPPPVKPGDSGNIGFDFDADADDANVSRGATPSELMRALNDDSAETPTREKPAAPVADGSGPSASVDWMAASNEEAALQDELTTDPEFGEKFDKRRAEKAKEKEKPAKPAPKRALASDTGSAEAAPAKAKPRRTADDTGSAETPAPPKQKGESRSLIVGALLGGLLAGGGFAGAYFGGLIPSGPLVVNNGNQNPNGKNPDAPPLDPRAALIAGDTKAALAQLDKVEPKTAAEKATAGQVRLFARLQELGTEAAKDDDAELVKARAHLADVVKDAAPDKESQKRAVAAAVQLGVSYEVAGNKAKAREVFTENRDKFADHKEVFEALLDRLDAAEKPAGAPLSRLDAADAERLLLALTVVLKQDPPKVDEPAEPGTAFWKAVNRAAGGKYDEARKLIAEAKALHEKRARALAGRGLNPLTDPLEQMFPKACDELATAWALRDKLYGNDAIAAAIKKDGLDKALAGLASVSTELVKVRGALTKSQEDLTTAKTNLDKANTNLKTATDKVGTLETSVETEKKAKMKFETDLGEEKKLSAKFKEAATKAELETASAKAATTKAEAAAMKAEAAAKTGTDALAALAKELGAPASATPADLLAAAKSATARATGPDLSKLIPKDWKGTLTAAQLEQLGKDLATAQKDALAAAKKAEGEAAALKLVHAKELMTEKAASELALKIEKEAAAKTQKELAANYDAAAKLAATKAAEALDAEAKKTAAAQKALVDQKIAFDKQLANAVTPSATMDLWLPVLTDLRRASDSPAARAAAEKALAASAPNSEDAAKAQTVNGMARLNAGDFAGAKAQFRAAKASPVFEPNAEKAWAKAAVLGLEAVDDPLALYRQKVETPATDARLAARALDAGVTAYRAGRYDDAVRDLTEAAKNAPADPLAWYYMGAAKWARGETDAARKDFAQGAEREKVSPVPSRVVSSALSPVQGAARDALDRARP